MSLISVIIPAWNARRWLPQTLESVFSQDGVVFEVVLVDDGSTDGTGELVADEWPQVRLVRSENRGVSHARNLGTAEARGDLIKYLDADDVLMSGTLARQAALMAAHPEADVAYGNWQRLMEQVDGSFVPADEVRRRIEEVHAEPELAFFSDFWCPTGAYLYRRSFLQKILPWKNWLPVVQDARFAWDAAAAGAHWVHDEEIGVLYRQHLKGSVSTRSRVAFLRDCLKNALSIQEEWRRRSTPDQWAVRQVRIIETLAALTRQAAALDDMLFEECARHLKAVSPNYQPIAPRWLATFSRVTGFSRAAKLAGLADRVRSRIWIDGQAAAR